MRLVGLRRLSYCVRSNKTSDNTFCPADIVDVSGANYVVRFDLFISHIINKKENCFCFHAFLACVATERQVAVCHGVE